MASAARANKVLSDILRTGLVIPTIAAGTAFAAYQYSWHLLAKEFFTGPGRISRIILLITAIINWKSLPFVWTYRVFNGFYIQLWSRKHANLGPRALYKPLITKTYAPITDIDFNCHKSNSTFFADADVARAHAVCYLLRPSFDHAGDNKNTRLVMNPRTGQPATGGLVPVLGGVQCSFKKEIKPFQSYELWTCFLSWDRKWLYVVTYFLPTGTAKPKEWLDPKMRGVKTRQEKKQGENGEVKAPEWEKKILATSVAKYVLKLGRITINPATFLEDSGLLPERPGGWTSGENQIGDESQDVSDVNLEEEDGEWDWKRVEAQRRKNWKYASQLGGLDEIIHEFEADVAIGTWGPG